MKRLVFETVFFEEYIEPKINNMIYYHKNEIKDERIHTIEIMHSYITFIKVCNPCKLEYIKNVVKSTNMFIKMFNDSKSTNMRLFIINKMKELQNV